METVTVQGKVEDAAALSAGLEKVITLSYLIIGFLGVLEEGDIQVGEDGSFSFQFVTVNFEGPIEVWVIARDWNNNIGQDSIILTDPGNDIPSFNVQALNRRVLISWEDFPGAESYTLYYTTDGNLPSASYGERIENIENPYTSNNPLVLTNLENGNMHVFLLKAFAPGNAMEWTSEIKRVIPLSEFTLAPVTVGEYGRIRVTWPEIQGTDEFEVLRSRNPQEPFELYSGVIRGNEFVDTGVIEGTWYYYKIRPTLANSGISTFNGAEPYIFPGSNLDRFSSVSLPGSAESVKISGSHAFIAAGAAGLQIIDVSVPADMKIIGSFPTSQAVDIDKKGNYVFIADEQQGFMIINVLDPFDPQLVDTMTWTGYGVRGVVVEGKYAFITDYETDIKIIDIENPESAQYAGQYTPADDVPSAEAIKDIHANGSFLFVVLSEGGWTVGHILKVNITEPTNPDISASVELRSIDAVPPGTHTHLPLLVVATENYTYELAQDTVSVGGFQDNNIIRVRDTSDLSELGASSSFVDKPNEMTLYNGQLFVANGPGIQVVDVSQSTNPTLVEYWNTPGQSFGVVCDERYTYVAAGELGLQMVDRIEIESPTVEQVYNSGGTAPGMIDLDILGNHIYALNRDTEIEIIDISQPTPQTVGRSDPLYLNNPTDIKRIGNYAFVADSILKIFDVSNPQDIQLRGTASFSGYMYAVEVRGDFAFCASSAGLEIYNISDPRTPFIVGFYDALACMNDVIIKGNLAYVLDSSWYKDQKLVLIDITDPRSPSLVDQNTSNFLSLELFRIDVGGNYAYIVERSYMDEILYIVDLSSGSPTYLSVVWSYTATGGEGYDIAAFGNYLCLVGEKSPSGGFLEIYHAFDPGSGTLPLIEALTWTNADPRSVIQTGGSTYVADDNEGLIIIKLF